MRKRSIVFLLLAVAISLSPSAAIAQEAPQHYLAEVFLASPQDLWRLRAAHFDVAGVNRGERTAGVVCTAEELARLTSLGYGYVVKEASHPLGGGPEALSDYTNPVEMSAFMDQVVSAHPTLARKILLEDALFEGQALYAMHITKDVDLPNGRPAFLLDAQHHAREVMTGEIARDAIDHLTSRYDGDPQVRNWVDGINIYIVPEVNPDGTMYVFTTDNMWRKNRDPQCGPGSRVGIDLNRNYPFFWAACEGSDGYCTSEVYRGTSPASEPETRGVMRLMDEARATFGISYHQYGEDIFYPYGCAPADEADIFQTYGAGIRRVLPDDQGRVGTYSLSPYGIDGASCDAEYGIFGTIAYLIEVGCCSFQPDYAAWRNVTVERQRKGWQYLLDQTLSAPQVRGRVTDARTGEPLRAQVGIQEVTLTHGEPPRVAAKNGAYHWLVAGEKAYHLAFSLPGYCSQEKAVQVGNGPAVLDVALEPSGTGVPGSPEPPDGAMNREAAVTLGWSDTGAASYEVRFGTSQDPPKVATVQASSYTVPQALEPGRTYYWKVSSASSCGSAPGPTWSFSTRPYAVTGVVKQGNPFRLIVSGSGFVGTCVVKIDGRAVPQTLVRGPASLAAKGGDALKAMVPKGTAVSVTVEDPQGGASNAFTYTR
jgi:hypothetical protein